MTGIIGSDLSFDFIVSVSVDFQNWWNQPLNKSKQCSPLKLCQFLLIFFCQCSLVEEEVFTSTKVTTNVLKVSQVHQTDKLVPLLC